VTKPRTDKVDIHYQTVRYLLGEVWPQAENLDYFRQSFPEENHGTAVLPGIYEGIKQLFGK